MSIEYLIDYENFPLEFFGRSAWLSASVDTIIDRFIPVVCGASSPVVANFLRLYVDEIKKVKMKNYRVEIRCHENNVFSFHFNISEAVRFTMCWRKGRRKICVITDKDIGEILQIMGLPYEIVRK